MTVTSRLHRQKDKERQRKTEEKVERRPVVTPRYESGAEAQVLVRPARDRGVTSRQIVCVRLDLWDPMVDHANPVLWASFVQVVPKPRCVD